MPRVPLVLVSSPYVTWIGSHGVTISWIPLSCTSVLYIPQWTGPTLAGVWTHKEVRIVFELEN